MEKIIQDLKCIQNLMGCDSDEWEYNMLCNEYCENELNLIKTLSENILDDFRISHPFIENIDKLSTNVKTNII